MIYVVFGGVWGTGFIGMLKVILVYITMFAAGWLAYQMSGGISGLQAPLLTILWAVFGRESVDPLYIGILTSLVTIILGSVAAKKNFFPFLRG